MTDEHDEHKGTTRRIDAGRRLLSNPRLARAALRAGFQSLPSATFAHLFRRVPPVSSTPTASIRQRNSKLRAVDCARRWSDGAPFAGYTILRPLGAGGMAEVYLALHPRLPRRDVIKVLAEAITADPEFRERFNREADLAATLWHPHIVGVHDRGEFNGQLWISMDYVEGTDAARLVKERYQDGMPIDEVCAILQAVAGALDYAHHRGLLHRDVKPANILLTHPENDERRILLADFGVARHLADISGITETNVAVGTVAYAAPEQLTGSNIDGRADQYALAGTAFHLLTGAPPFQHSNPIAVISQHLHEDPPRLSDYRPELAHLDDVFCKALAKDPKTDSTGVASSPPRSASGSAVTPFVKTVVTPLAAARTGGGADPQVLVPDPLGDGVAVCGSHRHRGDLVDLVLLPAGRPRSPTLRWPRDRRPPPPVPRPGDPGAGTQRHLPVDLRPDQADHQRHPDPSRRRQTPTGGRSIRPAPPTDARPPGPSSTTPPTRWPTPPTAVRPTRCASSADIGRARLSRSGWAAPSRTDK